ncbi:MAG TPA: HAD family hydrolase [Candidatus Dormibacteraeota bacterium]|jgi:HAD superfamily hydrolase (TIGR01509 family)|nr:HAD family hydrolase [Candidatus Dormibacteraeota bacterium]
MPTSPALLFDLDGTLVDSVYQHVLSWQEAMRDEGIELSVWRVHRRIGMSGGLFLDALAREVGRPITPEQAQRLRQSHAAHFLARSDDVRALPGARALLEQLTERGAPWAIATSGRRATATVGLRHLGLAASVPVVTRDDVVHAKPDPDLFLEAARRLDVDPSACFVVGDSVWDMLAAQRARSLGVGLLSGGYGREELVNAGAYRVYDDPRDLLEHLDEVGVRRRGAD